jgi:hypothetical protein
LQAELLHRWGWELKMRKKIWKQTTKN